MDEQSSLLRFLKDDLLRWKIFAVHLVLFGVVVVSSTEQSFFYPISLIWFCMVTLHFCFTFLNEKGRTKKKRLTEKPKRQYLEVGDDGELVEIVEMEGEEKRKNSAV